METLIIIKSISCNKVNAELINTKHDQTWAKIDQKVSCY